MKTSCGKYRPEDISLFVDKELLQEQYHEMEQHLVHCSHCRNLVRQYTSITDKFNIYVQSRDLKIDSGKLTPKLEHIRQGSPKKSLKNIFGIFNKNIYLKLASITAIFIVSMVAFQGGGKQVVGPSAIVTSVDTAVSSVMIIETQHTKHTIIWFSET